MAPGARLFRNSGAQSLVLTSSAALKRKKRKAAALEKRGVAVFGIEGRAVLAPSAILGLLGDLGISSVLIEGGANTIRPFLESGSVNKIHCFIAPKILGEGTTGLSIRSKGLKAARILNDVKVSRVGPDLLLEGTLK
jgi:diaminohydroxyphosphoribosylaminopyrimidine deaminase/5-amino-6-(5-phosphoribosylamino)uracil reductase